MLSGKVSFVSVYSFLSVKYAMNTTPVAVVVRDDLDRLFLLVLLLNRTMIDGLGIVKVYRW